MIRILVAVPRTAATSPQTRIGPPPFRQALEQALAFHLQNGAVALEFVAANENALRDCLAGGHWDAFHLVSHAEIRAAAHYATIALESSNGSLRTLSSNCFFDLLAGSGIGLLVLQSSDATSCFEPLAPELLGRGLPAVVTAPWLAPAPMNEFLAKLYSALAKGESVASISLPEVRIWSGKKPVPVQATELPATVRNTPEETDTTWRQLVAEKRQRALFDVFLCHNTSDKLAVKDIGQKLKRAGILPWLDDWELPPGQPWIPLLEKQIDRVGAAAVFIGSSGVGPWQEEELNGFLRQFVKRGLPVIPTLLPDAPLTPKLPIFLESRTWVDFRAANSNALEKLIWGITGKRPVDD